MTDDFDFLGKLPTVLDKYTIVPTQAYAHPTLAAHLDGSRSGIQIFASHYVPRGLVILRDEEGNIAFDRYHRETETLKPKLKAIK